jgi:hypothetical protein
MRQPMEEETHSTEAPALRLSGELNSAGADIARIRALVFQLQRTA